MKIEFPCPASGSELSPSERGLYCSRCEKEVVNVDRMSSEEIRNLASNNQSVCISTANIGALSLGPSIKKFALSLLIVFGSSLFKFSNAQFADSLGEIKMKAKIELSTVSMKIHCHNKEGDTLSSGVDVVVILPNGKEIVPIADEDGLFCADIPVYAKGRTVVVSAEGYGRQKSRNVYLVTGDMEVEVSFKFKAKRRKYYPRVMGCPSF